MARSSTSFQPGNRAARKHGARSPEERESYRKALIGEMRAHIETLLPELDDPSGLLVDLLAAALCDVRQLDEWINGMGGPVSPKGQIYNAVKMRRSRERDAVALLDRLGVGPRARSQVLVGLRLTAPGLASQLAQRRQEREREAIGDGT